MMPFNATAAVQAAEPSWLLPAVAIAVLALAVILSLALVLGLAVRNSYVPRPMVEADFDLESWGHGNPLAPSSWPITGRMTVDGFFPVRLSPAGEQVIVDDATGKIFLAEDYQPLPWRP
jgi:hypothetical protein